jgi:AA9 family protein
MTKNYQDDHGVTDVNSADIRCFQMRAGTGTAAVAAGGSLGFVADQTVTHPGPVQFYMARVPDAANVNSWEATGNVWFKVASTSGTPGGTEFNWPTYRKFRAAAGTSELLHETLARRKDLKSGPLTGVIPMQTRRASASPSPRRYPAATTLSVSRASLCTRPRTPAGRSSTSLAVR